MNELVPKYEDYIFEENVSNAEKNLKIKVEKKSEPSKKDSFSGKFDSTKKHSNPLKELFYKHKANIENHLKLREKFLNLTYKDFQEKNDLKKEIEHLRMQIDADETEFQRLLGQEEQNYKGEL